MKTYRFTDENDTNTADYYITDDGDIVDSIEDAEITGHAVSRVVVHGMYPGSVDDMRARAKRLYEDAIND